MHMRALKLTFGTSDQRYGCVGNVLPEERADSSSSDVIIVIASGLLGKLRVLFHNNHALFCCCFLD